MERFDGFSISLYKDEDGDWLAHFVELPNISAFSDTPEKALEELGIAWEGVRESYQKHGESVPGPPDMFRYAVNLIWSGEDNAYIATVPEFPNLSAFGKTPREAVREAETAVRGFIEVMKADGCEIPEPSVLEKAA